MLLRESMGVGADSTNKAFHAADINALLAREAVPIYRDTYETNDRENTNHVVLAVDSQGSAVSREELLRRSTCEPRVFPESEDEHLSIEARGDEARTVRRPTGVKKCLRPLPWDAR